MFDPYGHPVDAWQLTCLMFCFVALQYPYDTLITWPNFGPKKGKVQRESVGQRQGTERAALKADE